MANLQLSNVNIKYDTTGSGTPIVMIHGSAVDGGTWDHVVPALSANNRVITYDRRGYGQSTHKPVRDHRLHAADLIALLEQVAKEPAHVLGWSSGGNVAMAVAAERPDLVKSLFIIEAPFHGLRNMNWDVLRTLLRLKYQQLRGRPEAALIEFLRFGTGLTGGGNSYDNLPKAEQETLHKYWAPVLAEWDPHFFGVMHEHISMRAITNIKVPFTWALGAKGSPWIARLHNNVKRKAPHIKTVLIPDAGHLAHVDAPDAFIEMVEQHCQAT